MTASRSLDPDDVPFWLATLWPSRKYPDVITGINEDDCAVLSFKEEILVVTADFLNASPIALQLGFGNLHDLGRLLVAVNLADLCGSGANPKALLTAITMDHGSSTEDHRQLMLGIHEEATRWELPVVGGDTKLGSARALLAVAIGSAKSKQHLFLRNQARLGDEIWLSGEVGACCAAVVGLSDAIMSEEWNQWARQAVLRPYLPMDQSRRLSDAALAHAGTDISDGLGADLASICRASGVGARVFIDKLPIPAEVLKLASAMDLPPYRFALGVGGDLQFLVTAPTSSSDAMNALGFINIGQITAQHEIVLVYPDGAARPMPQHGHRDARRLSFLEEVRYLLTSLGEDDGADCD